MTALKHVAGARSETLQSVAQRMYDEAGQDENRAVEMMANYVGMKPRLRDELLRVGAKVLISAIWRSDQIRLVREGAAPTGAASNMHPTSAASIHAARERAGMVAGINTRCLMEREYKMPDGAKFKLGNGTAPMLKEVAGQRYGSGATMIREARYLERISAALPNGKMVREALGEAELAKMHDEAFQTPV